MHNKRKSLLSIILFFLIALAFSDGIWILYMPAVQEYFGYNLSQNWDNLGLLGPGLSAIIVALLMYGRTGLKELFSSLLRWRVPINYYMFIYLGVPLFFCAASWLTLTIQAPEQLHSLSALLQNVRAPYSGLDGPWFMLIEMTIVSTFCEELGWRGFALPELTKHINAFYAALLIGVFWAIWHIPLVYLVGLHFTFLTLLLFMLYITSFSIISAWLYFKTGRSLLMAGLFHGAVNGIGIYFTVTSSSVGQGLNLPSVIVLILIIISSKMIPYLFDISGEYRFATSA